MRARIGLNGSLFLIPESGAERFAIVSWIKHGEYPVGMDDDFRDDQDDGRVPCTRKNEDEDEDI